MESGSDRSGSAPQRPWWQTWRMTVADPVRPLIRTARDAADLFAPSFGEDAGATIAVAYLDSHRRLLALSESGDSALPVRTIIGEALKLDAQGLIVARNHAGGDPVPSEADRAATRLLAEAAAPLGIVLHDHLVFGGGECRSFRALGLL